MAQTQSTVDVILPNLPPEGALVRAEVPEWVDSDDVRMIGYPKFLFEYTVALDRLFMSDREVLLSITVDAVTGGRFRNDEYPEIESKTIDREALLQPRLNRPEAIDKAKSLVRRYISFHFPGYVMVSNLPDMEITRDDFVFQTYWLVPTSSEPNDFSTVTVLNTMTGDIVEEDIQLENVTADRLSD